MINALKDNLWKQFGASIDMLSNAIQQWPEEKWNIDKKFFYMAYHTLVFLDYYLTIPAPVNFSSQLPFTFKDSAEIPTEAIDDVIPDKIYTKQEILGYLYYTREKCRTIIAGLTEEKLSERWIEDNGSMDYAFLELLLYNMRHVQHHAAQLNLFLRAALGDAPRWVARAVEHG